MFRNINSQPMTPTSHIMPNNHRRYRRPCTIALFTLAAVVSSTLCIAAEKTTKSEDIVLWPEGAPGALGKDDVDIPILSIHRPAKGKENGAAVIVCPGGGYQHLASSYEGHDVADWFTSFGVTGLVLRYRLAPKYHHPTMMLDVQRAVRMVRSRSKEWNLDPSRIGVMGFSAGGHLASTAGTHFDAGQADATDPVDRVSCRPDFLVLAYPVISMTEVGHAGSRKNLLGENPDPKLIELMSNEKQVTKETPPTFLFHTHADTAVLPENSALFYLALKKAGVPAELHIYEQGPHGVGMAPRNAALSSWPGRLKDWMEGRGFLVRN